MAEIVAGVDSAPKKDDAPIVPEQKTEQPEVKELTATEKEAAAQGWDSLDDWVAAGHDAKDHRSAREYLDRGELLSKIKSQSQEMRDMRSRLDQMTTAQQNSYKQGYEQALIALRQQKAAAIKDADGDRVVEIDAAIDATKDRVRAIEQAQQAPQPQQPQGEDPTFTQFKKDNPWYNQHAALRKWAHGEAIDFGAARGNRVTQEEVYAHLARAVKIEFPEKFQKKGPPSPDGEGRSSSSPSSPTKGNGAFEKLLATLPEDQAYAARSLVKSGALTAEKYVEDYEAIGRNR